MTQTLKKHWGVILTGVFIGFLYFLPNIIGALKGNIILNFEEAFSYGVKVREVMDGHLADGDPYLAEYKNKIMTWDYYPLSLPLGLLAKLLQMDSPEQLFIWSDLFLPPIIFFIIYFVFFAITSHRTWSMLASFVFTAFPNIFVYKNILSAPDFLTWLESGFNPDFSRLFVPALTMIFFSIFLASFLKLYKNDKNGRRGIIFAGISYGLLFYVYFYYWVFATIALILGIIIIWLARDKRKAKQVLIAFGIGAAVSAFHWFRYFLLFKNPSFKEYINRIGIEYAHAPRWESFDFVLLTIALVIILWYFRKHIGMRVVFFLISLLVAAIVALNLQTVFGFNPQPDHWASRVNIYIFILGLMTALFFILRRFLIFSRFSMAVLAAVFVIALSAQMQKIAAMSYDFYPSRALREAYQWINKNIPSDSVFVTPAMRSRILLPYFTHANVYLPMACLSLASQEEIRLRYLEVYRLFKIPEELVLHSMVVLKDDFSKYDESVYLDEFETYFSIFCDQFNPAYRRGKVSEKDIIYRGAPKELINKFLSDYDAGPPLSFKDLKWRADYVFWGPGEKLISQINPDKIDELELIYSDNLVKIYKIKFLQNDW